MPRYRANFLSGVASGVQNSTGQTVITGTNWPTNIPAGSYLPVTLNPGYFGANNTSGPEVIYVTSVSSNVATAVRQQENSSLASGTVVPWVAGPLVADFDVSNLTSTGTLTLNNVLVVSGGGTSISAPNGSIVLGNSATVSGEIYALNTGVAINAPSGNVVVGGNTTVTGYSTALGGIYFSTSNKSAAGTSQATATSITTQYTVVNAGTTATSNGQTGQAAVVLPNIVYLGQTIFIDNSTSNWLLVYPYSTQQIDSAGSSNPIWLAPSAYWQGIAETTGVTGSWASFVPSFNSDSSNSINITYTNGQIQYGINPVVQATTLTVTGGATVLGSLGVAGNFNVNGTSIVLPSGALQVGGNATVTGNVTVTGNITTSGGKVVTGIINSPGYTAYSIGSTGGVLVNGVQFPILNTSSGIISPLAITSGNYLSGGIQSLTLGSGTWLLTARVAGVASATAITDLWIGPSYTTASGCYGITTTTFVPNNPVTATVTCIANITNSGTVYLQGYQAASPVATVTLASGAYYSAAAGGITPPYSSSTVSKSTGLTAFQLA